jgi:GT2 family glycosyltransferase
MNIELSVIIVNYNGRKYLKECFEALTQKLSGIAFEIIVIDNDSQDKSCDFIKENYPNVVLIESKINYGFGKGNNEAVKLAKGDYLLLINNDTIVLDNLLPVLDFLKADKKIGIIGINMLNADKHYIPAAGNFPNVRNMFQLIKLLDISEEFKKGIFSRKAYEVGWMAGSFFMMEKKVYDGINGFDEDYFLYVEDVDFCKRIAGKGYKRVFLPGFDYIHFVGFNPSKNLMLIKGYEIYIDKHFGGVKKILMLGALKANKFVKNLKRSLKLN